jgi:NlpC/P60 family putative phage cell wall peptidase
MAAACLRGHDMSDHIITLARSWIGTPYQHQASLKGVGCDCLGLLRGIWRELYGSEPEAPPPYTPGWAEDSKGDALTEAADRWLIRDENPSITPGSILLFRWRDHLPAKHCAIATEHDHIIHAHDGACVSEVALGSWWRRHVSGRWVFP